MMQKNAGAKATGAVLAALKPNDVGRFHVEVLTTKDAESFKFFHARADYLIGNAG